MKTRFYIMEIYCGGHLNISYSVTTEEKALETLQRVKEFNEPNAYIRIEKQTKKWYQRYWRVAEVMAEWWN